MDSKQEEYVRCSRVSHTSMPDLPVLIYQASFASFANFASFASFANSKFLSQRKSVLARSESLYGYGGSGFVGRSPIAICPIGKISFLASQTAKRQLWRLCFQMGMQYSGKRQSEPIKYHFADLICQGGAVVLQIRNFTFAEKTWTINNLFSLCWFIFSPFGPCFCLSDTILGLLWSIFIPCWRYIFQSHFHRWSANREGLHSRQPATPFSAKICSSKGRGAGGEGGLNISWAVIAPI